MNTLTIMLLVGGYSGVAFILGVSLGIVYRRRHEPAELRRLRTQIDVLQRRAEEREAEIWRVIGQHHREAIAMFVGRS
jgi:hypothetical protein